MGKYAFKLPDVGEGIAESEIATWRVAVGDAVTEDQPLVDMLTEKAAVELPSPVHGKVLELRGEAGDMISVGSVLVILEVEGEGNALGAAETETKAEVKVAATPESNVVEAAEPAVEDDIPVLSAPAAPAAVPRTPGEKPVASPAVRRRAREMGVELSFVPGSGPGGRIMHEDLDAYAHGPRRAPGGAAISGPRTEVETIKVIGLRRKIAEAMQRSKQRIPHFAYVEEIDVTELEALRVHLNDTRKPEQAKLTLLPFLMQALVRAVPEFPMVNATYDDEAGIVTRYAGLHVGIATQTPNGLVVPVARHAETMDLWTAAAEVKRLAEAARSGKASREELSGSSITITSLGPMGGIVSTPVINAPEVGIIGVNKMVERPMVVNGQIAVRKMMNLSSSFDHRIVDGWDAASFIQRIKALLEHPATLFMH